MKKKRLMSLLLILMPLLTSAQGLRGAWKGLLEAGPAKLNIVFHIHDDNTVTMDSPGPGGYGSTDESGVYARRLHQRNDAQTRSTIYRKARWRRDKRHILTDGTLVSSNPETRRNKDEPSADTTTTI